METSKMLGVFDNLRKKLHVEDPILSMAERVAAVDLLLDHWETTNFERDLEYDAKKSEAYYEDLCSKPDKDIILALNEIGWN